jgi:hypothetical protein
LSRGDPAAAVSRPFWATVKLSIKDVLSRVPTKRSPVLLNKTSPTAEPSGTATVDDGIGMSLPTGFRRKPV